MNSRALLAVGVGVVAIVALAWIGLRPARSHERDPGAGTAVDDPAPVPAAAAVTPRVAFGFDAAASDAGAPDADLDADSAVASDAEAADADSDAEAGGALPLQAQDTLADERTVLGMYQNLADAVDAYGADACAAMGQAFGAFVNDGAQASARLVAGSRIRGEDYPRRLEGILGSQTDRVRAKLKEALTRCPDDPGVLGALRALAAQK
jgi:hypothetical protein